MNDTDVDNPRNRGQLAGQDTNGATGVQDAEPVVAAQVPVLVGEEAELLSGVRAGDTSAMSMLYERYRAPGLRFIRSLMSGSQEAEDVFHEAFTKAVSAIRNGFGPSDVFGAYLNTAIKSVVNTLWSQQRKEQPTPDDDMNAESAEDPGLDNALSLGEHEHILVAMRSLPARWREVLWYSEVMGATPREIAPIMGISSNAVSALRIRARAGLRAAYASKAKQ
ncbi:RNA polymerase sigma factor [Paenarthrobacter histidinolovorans]|uniref:RNA polymerase sigma factor (Sigma-70 family) n=1 Tax=Paenarthrobacter histidinolovorans TaxID=43664 RepID=A0ABW8N0P6_9MICC